jgi:hypothetical protein
VVLSLVFDLFLNLFHDPKYKEERTYFYSLFSMIEYSFLSIFFYLTFRNPTFKRLLAICYPVFIAIAVYNLIYSRNENFDSLPAPIEAILVIVFSILFFYEQLTNPEATFIYASKAFWIVTACMIYFSSTLFLFISTAYLPLDKQLNYWPINNVANIIKNIFFAIAFSKTVHRSLTNGAK